MLTRLLKKRLGTPRWPYVVLATLIFPFIGVAFDDGGPVYGSVFAAVFVASVLQAVRPTVAGWACVFGAFLVYAVIDAPRFGPLWLRVALMMLTASLHTGAFWLLRPWKQWPSHMSEAS